MKTRQGFSLTTRLIGISALIFGVFLTSVGALLTVRQIDFLKERAFATSDFLLALFPLFVGLANLFFGYQIMRKHKMSIQSQLIFVLGLFFTLLYAYFVLLGIALSQLTLNF